MVLTRGFRGRIKGFRGQKEVMDSTPRRMGGTGGRRRRHRPKDEDKEKAVIRK